MNINKTPFLFPILMRAYSGFFIKSPQIQGLNNLTQIPLNQPLVIACTHLSDIDVQTIAGNIAPYRNIGIASQTSNQNNIITGSFLRIAGTKNVFGISNVYDSKEHRSRYIFKHNDFKIMSDAIQKGKTIVIAAHNPTYDWKLPEKPGKGAVYLAQLSNAIILPIALEILSDKPVGMADDKINSVKRFLLRKKTNSRIVIGKPITLPKMKKEELQQIANLYQTKTKNQVSKRDLEKAKSALKKIKEQAEIIMSTLRDMLPPNKRAIHSLMN